MNNTDQQQAGTLTLEVLSGVLKKVPKGSKVKRVILNHNDWQNTRSLVRDVFDPNTQVSDLIVGFHGHIWQVEVWIRKSIPQGSLVRMLTTDTSKEWFTSDWAPKESDLIRF